MGTPDFSVPALRAVAARCDVTLVVTQPDRPRGRGRQMAESEVAATARELGLPVLKPEDMKTDEVFEALSAQNADAFAVVAFGAILTSRVLALPRAGCVNLHGSLLPDYRGASPVQRALWDGRTETGVCTIFMDEGIDTGDIVLTHREAVRDDDDAASLAARLAEAGGPLLAESVVLAHEGRAMRSKQDRTAGSYAKKLKKSDGIVDWSLTAREVWCHARAVTPWPGATAMHDGKRLLVVRSQVVAGQGEPGTVLAVEHEGVAVACGTDALRLIRVKPEGRAEMAASEWARGARVSLGDHGLYSKESKS
jgi:methionyl-tRNA formyltransferase